MLTNINASLTLLQNRIDKGIPITNKERFEQQVVNADSLGLDEINRTYFLLSPEKQAILESVASELSIGAIDIANEHPFEQDIETHLNYGNETVL